MFSPLPQIFYLVMTDQDMTNNGDMENLEWEQLLFFSNQIVGVTNDGNDILW